MRLKFLFFFWVCAGGLSAQDSTCYKIESGVIGYYSYFFSFDADYGQYFKAEKIKDQKTKALRYAVLDPTGIHCSTLEFGFNSYGKVKSVVLLDSELPVDWYQKLVIIRDSSDRITQKIRAPIDENGMIDTVGQYSVRRHLYDKGRLSKIIEERRNGELSQTVKDFQYDTQNRIKRIDYQFIGSKNEIKEHFTFRYKKNKSIVERYYYHSLDEKWDHIGHVETTTNKFDQNGRLILKKTKHPNSDKFNTRTKFNYNDVGLLISFKTKRTKGMAHKGDRIWVPFKCEYRNGVLSSLQYQYGTYSIKRIN